MKQLVTILLILTSCMTYSGCRRHTPIATSSATLRVSTEAEPKSLDPRIVRDLPTVTYIHTLYEGLMRQQAEDIPQFAMAKDVEISSDKKTYTFKLRESAWSDGSPVTAYDFEKTWKSHLNPSFASPNANQFYIIEGAKEAKEGTASIDTVGIVAENEKTLTIQLKEPVPHFLNLVSAYFFYPVHVSMRENKEDLTATAADIITNGPFQLEKWSHHNELTVIPNQYYWDKQKVRLKKIAFILLDNPTALQLYLKDEIDWTGSPLSTLSIDALPSLKQSHNLKIVPGAGVYLFRINTTRPPFNDIKIRKALALALKRTDLIEHVLQGYQTPAMGLIPPSFIEGTPLFEDYTLIKAQELFKEGMQEQNLNSFPPITIHYAAGERAHKIAQVAQQQWKESLGIEIALQSTEPKVFFDQIKNQDYELGIGSWFADFHDPLSFLDVFKYKNNGTNNTGWENVNFIKLLDESWITTNEKRTQILKDAEKLLIDEMPVIPLFYSSYLYLQNSLIKNVYFSELGYLDFKNAYFEERQPS